MTASNVGLCTAELLAGIAFACASFPVFRLNPPAAVVCVVGAVVAFGLAAHSAALLFGLPT